VIKPEDANRLMLEALVLQRNAHPDIVYENHPIEPALQIACDRRLISQALINLLQNAADAIAMADIGKGGRIETSIEAAEGWLSISVADNGVGLPKEEPRERLTEPYVTHKPKGTGLGLAIVKKIMEDHGGTVMLEDRAEGPGSVARLILPLGESPWHPAQASSNAEPEGGNRSAHGA